MLLLLLSVLSVQALTSMCAPCCSSRHINTRTGCSSIRCAYLCTSLAAMCVTFLTYAHMLPMSVSQGSATGAYSPLRAATKPSFVLMDVDGSRVRGACSHRGGLVGLVWFITNPAAADAHRTFSWLLMCTSWSMGRSRSTRRVCPHAFPPAECPHQYSLHLCPFPLIARQIEYVKSAAKE
jgi:hypothetical protein